MDNTYTRRRVCLGEFMIIKRGDKERIQTQCTVGIQVFFSKTPDMKLMFMLVPMIAQYLCSKYNVPVIENGEDLMSDAYIVCKSVNIIHSSICELIVTTAYYLSNDCMSDMCLHLIRELSIRWREVYTLLVHEGILSAN